ncbi:polysaccharide lyase family 7 protein [Catenovulum adriaticum]|uniref:Polysaccharide lyase family 7 protein n=1 Tax=Catenovulum adriaticum TaxID=2984846 RepID=A0ABY7AUY7_9ALTE|nr:polysaccharide lyase family 7 protein [Catenovulum sp. TS8]WAJ72154.1 polysaccharide lyase family 7 protein [Catenovulum sp. TS8]
MNYTPKIHMTTILLIALIGCENGKVETSEPKEQANLGFEFEWQDWSHTAQASISNQAYSGNYSAQISGPSDAFEKSFTVEPNTHYQISAFTKGNSKIGVKTDSNNKFSTQNNGDTWQRHKLSFNSLQSNSIVVYAAYNQAPAWYDEFNLTKTNPPTDITNCEQPYTLPITSAAASTFNASFSGNLAIDNNLSDNSRWSSTGTDESLLLDLGEISVINSLDINWYLSSIKSSYFEVTTSLDGHFWQSQLTNQASSLSVNGFETFQLDPHQARYLKIIAQENSIDDENSLLEIKVKGCNASGQAQNNFNLNPDLPPSGNFDLLDWTISVPIDEDGNNRSDHIKEQALANGYTHSDYFYTADDGGMVFRATVAGYKTSTNTNYTRSELREMLRRGKTEIETQGISKNNWVFSSYPADVQANYGGVDGTLTATLKVDHVTTTGQDYQIGRVIIGQIHAADDEPARLYYRKLPNNSKGVIYLVHEPLGGDDQYYEMIGSRSNSASNPTDGIALGEIFSYKIQVTGHNLNVTISREGKADVVQTVDMSNSGYHLVDDEYMYFKAGAYNQNNSGEDTDYVQTTFYQLENTHSEYDY